MHGKGQQRTLAHNEHSTDSLGLPVCSLVSPSKTSYLPPVHALLTGYTWVRGPGIQQGHPSPPGSTCSHKSGLIAPPCLRHGCCRQHRGGLPCLSPIGRGSP
eukprot:2155307-Rhodomonas_salina.1